MTAAAREHRVRSGRGELAIVEAGDPARPSIVFVHGYPDTKELWEPVMARLRSSFHVVAYDVRGAGASTAPRGPRAYALARLAGDLEAVIDAIAPGKRIHLVGHDWGGVAGWEFASAQRFRDRLGSFTSVAGPSLDHVGESLSAALASGGLPQAVGALRHSWYIAVLCIPGGPSICWSLLGRERWRSFLQHREGVATTSAYPSPTVREDGRRGANLYRANIACRLLRRRHAPARAHVPVQLIVPDGDRFIPRRYYERAESAAPLLRRRRVPGSHWAPRTQPALVARWVAEWVVQAETDLARAGSDLRS